MVLDNRHVYELYGIHRKHLLRRCDLVLGTLRGSKVGCNTNQPDRSRLLLSCNETSECVKPWKHHSNLCNNWDFKRSHTASNFAVWYAEPTWMGTGQAVLEAGWERFLSRPPAAYCQVQ